jgi:hypothetical protein
MNTSAPVNTASSPHGNRKPPRVVIRVKDIGRFGDGYYEHQQYTANLNAGLVEEDEESIPRVTDPRRGNLKPQRERVVKNSISNLNAGLVVSSRSAEKYKGSPKLIDSKKFSREGLASYQVVWDNGEKTWVYTNFNHSQEPTRNLFNFYELIEAYEHPESNVMPKTNHGVGGKEKDGEGWV